jgi:S1-C subfamily serine protease
MRDKRNPLVRAALLAVLIVLIAVAGAAVNVAAFAATAATTGSFAHQPTEIEKQSRALERASAATVGVRSVALDEARSSASLGRVRQGSGVVIGNDGLVLTIGYLILEADQVQLVMDDQRIVPARVLGYDVATGFGLLQALAPLRLEPVPLGASAGLQPGEPLLIASGGEEGGVSMAQMVSRRGFAGYWEYHIDGALFTAPARTDHSGAGLFNARGELVGIGSLVVSNALGDEGPRSPGNMFVPIDLLRPILSEMRSRGMSAASRRAWIGVNCVEQAGEVRVLRVNADSPADVAGLQPGDRIVRIDGTEVRALEALWKSLWTGGQPEREVTLDIERDQTPQTLKLQSVDRMKTLKHAQGI